MQTALSFNILGYERASGASSKEDHPIAVDWNELEIPRPRAQWQYVTVEMLGVIDSGQILKICRLKLVSRDNSWLGCGSVISHGIL